jgi:opacity protein-like surface antigen
MSIATFVLRTLLASWFALAAAAPAVAQSATTEKEGWQFELTPYLWAPDLKGSVQINNAPKAKLDLSAWDLIQMLDFSAAGRFEARNGRWGAFADVFYAKVSDGGDGEIKLRRGPGIEFDANLKMKQIIGELGGGYRIVEGSTPVDLIAGGRYNKIDMDAKVEATGQGPLGLSASRTASYEKNWWDPYVGVRVKLPIADKWSLLGYGDVGGFRNDSRTYQLIGGVNYDYSRTVSFKAGYRFYHVNYDKGGFDYDMNQRGFTAGVGFKF